MGYKEWAVILQLARRGDATALLCYHGIMVLWYGPGDLCTMAYVVEGEFMYTPVQAGYGSRHI